MKENKQKNPSLLQSFTVVSLLILMLSLVVTGWWVSRQITQSVISRVGHATSLFAGSVIAPYVLEMLSDPDKRSSLEQLMDRSSLGEEIVAFKVWGRDGTILFSTNEIEIDQKYPIEAGLKNAWNGVVSAELSDLSRDEHAEQRRAASRLLETYTPVREPGTGRIVAVVEFYQSVDDMVTELRSARMRSWAIVSAVVIMIYLSLVMVVRSGSRTIVNQRDELQQRVAEYRELLDANTELNRRVNSAAIRTTALNDRFLRGIAAELHDGPAQDIGYSLLMIDEVKGSEDCQTREATKKALGRALDGIRDVSAGLRSPELEKLDLQQVVDRAIRIHGARSRGVPDVRIDPQSNPIGLAAKITVYRVIQEALSNAFKHAHDEHPTVVVNCTEHEIVVSIHDHGSGIRPGESQNSGMGLSIMQERVELLGGIFAIKSDPSLGTTISATIPMLYQEQEHGG